MNGFSEISAISKRNRYARMLIRLIAVPANIGCGFTGKYTVARWRLRKSGGNHAAD
jgi:hypothetical protein